MGKTQAVLNILLAVTLLIAAPDSADAKKKKDRVARDFRHADTNNDGRLSPAEWKRRGNFERLDANRDGTLSLNEVRAMYKGHGKKNYDWPPQGYTPPAVDIDPSIKADRKPESVLDYETRCGLGRSKRCDIAPQIKHGLLETGTGPRFPDGVKCPGMDDYWGMDYASKRNRQSYHGGIDLPAAWGTPMRAVADGAVVAMHQKEMSKRGYEVILRHSPEQTGVPMWTYSGYGHLDKLPDFQIGQRLKMGEIIGPTGNSGIAARGGGQSLARRPAIHLAMWYGETPHYSESDNVIIPVDGYWLDPFAFYRQKPPFFSPEVKALPDNEKDVDIPVMFDDGSLLPPDTKMIWPYTCAKDE